MQCEMFKRHWWQVKRTNVGVALITSPKVLFLDEPTSGVPCRSLMVKHMPQAAAATAAASSAF